MVQIVNCYHSSLVKLPRIIFRKFKQACAYRGINPGAASSADLLTNKIKLISNGLFWCHFPFVLKFWLALCTFRGPFVPASRRFMAGTSYLASDQLINQLLCAMQDSKEKLAWSEDPSCSCRSTAGLTCSTLTRLLVTHPHGRPWEESSHDLMRSQTSARLFNDSSTPLPSQKHSDYPSARGKRECAIVSVHFVASWLHLARKMNVLTRLTTFMDKVWPEKLPAAAAADNKQVFSSRVFAFKPYMS